MLSEFIGFSELHGLDMSEARNLMAKYYEG